MSKTEVVVYVVTYGGCAVLAVLAHLHSQRVFSRDRRSLSETVAKMRAAREDGSDAKLP